MRVRTKVSALALMAATAFPQLAFAQERAEASAKTEKPSEDGSDIVVTGVVTGRQATPSIAISVVDLKTLQSQVPISAADLLRNVPGVFVNSALGEVRNIVYSRGVAANSSEAASGYYYVSLQEDGLPVTNVTATNYSPDFFYRQDLSLGRLEALRGGTAVVTGPNAPGGIFNYISRNGKSSPGIEASARFGLLGDGRNPYYRTDAYVGGRFGQSDFYYNVGGFYRSDRGSRDPGYDFNRGGQVKASILWDTGHGSVQLSGKYLDDHNAFYEFLPATNFDDPRVIASVGERASFLPPRTRFSYTPFTGAAPRTYDSTGLTHSTSWSIGLKIDHDFGDGWRVDNNARYVRNQVTYNTGAVIFSAPITDIVQNSFLNTLGAGVYNYRDRATGSLLLQVNRAAANTPGTVTVNNLPNQNVLANGVLSQVAYDIEPIATEFMDQFSVTKKLATMTFRVGTYFALSDYKLFSGSAGIGLSPIQNQPRLFDITRTTATGVVQQVTSSEGYAGVGQRLGGTQLDFRQTQFSAFAGHNWDITDRLNSDLGVRYERITVGGTTRVTTANPNSSNPAFGGNDGNPNTLFDNFQVGLSTPLQLDYTLDYVSYSGALTYRFSSHDSIFARYSQGQKAPDLGVYQTVNSAALLANFRPIPQTVEQIEIGFRHADSRLRATITPFYSRLGNVTSQQLFTRADGSTYTPLPLPATITTYGVEIESDFDITNTLNLATALTIQQSDSAGYRVYVANAPGEADDTISAVPDGKADNIADVMATTTLRFTPTERFSSFVSWKYLGSRPANRFNTFNLPAFSQIDLGTRYGLTRNLTIGANISNLLNSQGVFSWAPSGGLLASLDRQAFTPAQRAANPGQTFNIITVQPRAFYISASIKF